jgi:hypothetical protein
MNMIGLDLETINYNYFDERKMNTYLIIKLNPIVIVKNILLCDRCQMNTS